ncbi:MAG: hypothetical protein LBT99_04530 [Bifidobacteriaceae bacterium]|jgi:hypothetical protein|nr:hypothetical protein [Bifidobacteriaceae bacterium]
MEIRKIGAKVCLWLICIATFTGGLAVTVQAATSTAPLPLSHGGTGQTKFDNSRALATNADGSAIITKPYAVDAIKNSDALMHEGGLYSDGSYRGAYKYVYKRDLKTADVITINSEYYAYQASTPVKVWRIGDLMFIQGPFQVIKPVDPASGGYARIPIFSIKSDYLPGAYISVDCSNNFVGIWATESLTCGYLNGNVKASTTGSIETGKFIDINFIYLIG